MDKEDLKNLANKIAEGTATKEEIILFNQLCNSFEQNDNQWNEELLGNKKDLKNEMLQAINLKTGYKKPVFKMKIFWMAAASVALIFVTIYFLQNRKTIAHLNTYFAKTAEGVIEKNNSKISKQIILKDGSKILLAPNSKITYYSNFNDSIREVYLEGNAFFQVAKNPSKPFFVYYNNIVTKVLGTSFSIDTDPQTGNFEVSVKTGRVQVYENVYITKSSKPVQGVILTPNQKAVYQKEKKDFLTALVNEPEPIVRFDDTEKKEIAPPLHFVFEETKLPVIFAELENAYGIEIVVENTNLNNCVFTGDISNQNLFTKLKTICLTTNSTYEVIGTRILIKGIGCN